MKKHEIVWTAFAVSCLDEIHEFIFQESYSEKIANRLVSKLIRKIDQVALLPKSGTIEPLLKHTNQGSRYLLEGNYKIIYQFTDEIIIVTDVFHTKQNPNKMIKRNKKNDRN